MDFLTDLAPLIISIGVGAIPVVGGIASTAILATLRDRNMNTMWFEVVSRAGGLAYQHLVQSGRPLDKPALTSAAAVGASYILAQAELGKLLAQDPTIGPEPPLTIPTENTSHG
jgi:hypothetical protein